MTRGSQRANQTAKATAAAETAIAVCSLRVASARAAASEATMFSWFSSRMRWIRSLMAENAGSSSRK